MDIFDDINRLCDRWRLGREDLERAHAHAEHGRLFVIGVRDEGEILKAVGTYARIDMENLFGMRVFLNLWVKVKEGWREDERMLTELGY